MIRTIVRYGDRTLHSPAEHVAEITTEIQTIITDMIETMLVESGVGLAAPQIGIPLRIFVADPSGGQDENRIIVMVNPEWIERRGTQREDEGCLSVPGFSAPVPRPVHATVRGLDRDGTSRDIEGTGILARAFAHEMDHLDGSLFLDHLRGIRRDMMLRKIRKLRRSGKW
tara:strand:+ start:291 stop:800 length:510 start_codon:yes stop_codon:yes gene_type:complete